MTDEAFNTYLLIYYTFLHSHLSHQNKREAIKFPNILQVVTQFLNTVPIKMIFIKKDKKQTNPLPTHPCNLDRCCHLHLFLGNLPLMEIFFHSCNKFVVLGSCPPPACFFFFCISSFICAAECV